MASAQVELNDQHKQKGASATLTNQTVADMQLIRSFTWSGFGSFPGTITSRGGVARFTHLTSLFGSEAGVSYSITTPAGNPAAVILAWMAPPTFGPSPNKIYAACGPRDLIDKLTSDQIRRALDVSTCSVDVNCDGVCVKATITNNPVTEMADIVANFGYCLKP